MAPLGVSEEHADAIVFISSKDIAPSGSLKMRLPTGVETRRTVM